MFLSSNILAGFCLSEFPKLLSLPRLILRLTLDEIIVESVVDRVTNSHTGGVVYCNEIVQATQAPT